MATRLNFVKNFSKKLSDKLVLPEKYKGTAIEKWTKYWKQVVKDYIDVTKDIVKSAQDRPRRAMVLYGSGGFALYCITVNPTYQDYLAQLRNYQCEMTFVAEPVRSPTAVKYLQFLESNHNEGRLRRMSLGVFSIMWIADYNKDLNLYKAICKYLGPEILTFHTRIVDFGILEKWWIMDRKMVDYDVNFDE